MNFNRFFVAVLISPMLLLGACSSEQTPTPSAETPEVGAELAKPVDSPEKADHSAPAQGGQVVEVGDYHLELVALPDNAGTHLDLFLLSGDTHEPIPEAQVTAQVQLPDGSQQAVPMDYDAAGKHYAGTFSESAPGEYGVAIVTDIQGKKVNARFNFTL